MDHKLPTLEDIPDLSGIKVLLRAPLNVPIKDGRVVNDFRLERTLKTVAYLTERGARVIMIGHIGREKVETLEPVHKALAEHITLAWCDEIMTPKMHAMADALHDGEVLLLENLRSHDGETANDPHFAAELASLAAVYVNDAFSVSHREHASVVGIPKLLPSYAGMTFMQEVTELGKARKPEHPSLFILGGAKFETKEPLIAEFLETYDRVFVGGAIANDFYKADGLEVGVSQVSKGVVPESVVHHPHISLPERVVVKKADGSRETKSFDAVEAEEAILDGVFPESLLAGVKTVLWNGPIGYYEGGYDEGTVATAMLLSKTGAYTVVGGGDTIAAIERLGLNDTFNFVSTAGGAMLTFLEEGTLPGIEALLKSK
ncbi:phosphoglycerate kinase [Candidatus Parcubacteria bacterium]|uniref:Phosphoglycerate kinase n=1 Tax=Candidatus Kaiserbacteria bacterium CG10_big_fil_rev_8_21_14_0_10_47_16 TaxID=1974608 RepID=A0A2H0UDS4_9BACT|nr:phosphoglycerate kinase [Candidatus Parcubacteria bacterium]PIR84559.1 MAG: phosphoglycerate kinase [Candidatus Kaiserbacteria bacterium CG10_big_fil_rev_8_21_14_0_10_47_16]